MQGDLPAVIPSGRGLLRLSCGIIGPPLFSVGKDFVGFTRRPEFMRIGVLPDLIRMIALDGVAVCFFDLIDRCIFFNAKNFLVISVVHLAS